LPKRKLAKPIVKPLYAGKLDRFTKKEGIWAGRFPTSFLDAAVTNPSPIYGNSTGGYGSRDPYTNASKNRFEDTFRADSTAQNAIMLLVKLVLGKKHQPVLDTTEQFASDDLRMAALDKIMSAQENQQLIADIQKVEEKCKFHEKLMASQAQKYTFGRSALGIIFEKKMPAELKVLSSKNLGQVYSNKETWAFEGVDYHDIRVQQKRIPASELLYFTNLDYNVTPDTMYYGISKIEGVAHASETKRIILEEDLKESAKGQWAGIGIVKGAGIVDEGQADELVNAFDPGKWNFTNADVTVEVHKIADNIDKLSAMVENQDKYIIRGIGVPSMMLGFEDVQNYATANEVMEVWKATTGEFERAVLQSQLYPQWYESLLKILYQGDLEKAAVCVKAEFEDILFETFESKVKAIKMLEEIGVPLPLEEKLNRLGLEHISDQIAELAEQQKQEQAEEREAMMKVPPNGKGFPPK
jgi:hypothetical protein